MAVLVVAFDGTRINASDANTNWAKVNAGGGAPAAEAQISYQNSLAVNVKATNTAGAFGGLEYNPASGAVDMTAAANQLCFLQLNISDFGDLNATWGAKVWIGSSSTDYLIYNFAGTGAKRSVFNTWPAQGGYILTALNPNNTNWRDATSPQGSPSLTAIDYFAFLGSWVAGGAKAENLAFDSISIGRGLKMTRGDGANPDCTYEDMLSWDEGTKANRYGVLFSKNGIMYCVGKLTIGESATATEFTDTGTVIMVFPDGYVSSGDLGELYDIQNASTVIVLNESQLIGAGSATTSDTRPTLTVTGTSGSFEMDGSIRKNYEKIDFSSACDIHDVDIQCKELIQNSCDIYDSIIRTTSLTSVATLVTPTFGTVTDLRDCEFVQEGAGHAIELATVGGTYNMQGLEFTGYGADASDSAALDITAASGTTTLNLSNMSTPTYKTAGATVQINNNVTITLTNLQSGTEIRVYKTSDDSVVDGIESSGTSWAFSAQSGLGVYIRIFHVNYLPADIEGYTIPASATSIPIQQVFDRNYDNP